MAGINKVEEEYKCIYRWREGITPLLRDDTIPVNCNGAGLCQVGVISEGSNNREEDNINLFYSTVKLDKDEWWGGVGEGRVGGWGGCSLSLVCSLLY